MLLRTCLGTPGYQAPEIVLKQPYEGAKIDIFALGVILFVMIGRAYPFVEATASDGRYKCLIENKPKEFWYLNGFQDTSIFSDDLKSLIF